jgi:hypothetical protein
VLVRQLLPCFFHFELERPLEEAEA